MKRYLLLLLLKRNKGQIMVIIDFSLSLLLFSNFMVNKYYIFCRHEVFILSIKKSPINETNIELNRHWWKGTIVSMVGRALWCYKNGGFWFFNGVKEGLICVEDDCSRWDGRMKTKGNWKTSHSKWVSIFPLHFKERIHSKEIMRRFMLPLWKQ